MPVTPIPCLKDNYAYLVTCPRTGEHAVVDVSEAAPVLAALRSHDARPRAIWSTHHHFDHVGGNEELAGEVAGVEVCGHASDRGRIPAQTRFLEEGDELALGDLRARILHIPGHTLGAVAYVVEGDGAPMVFTGDTLFVAGCGRLFEGTPVMMHASLSKLAALPPETRVYCGHEYTQANLRFAAHVEPHNAAVARARERADTLRAKGEPTVPSTIGEELQHNPFLRVRSEEIRRTLHVDPGADAAAAFGAIRAAKDSF